MNLENIAYNQQIGKIISTKSKKWPNRMRVKLDSGEIFAFKPENLKLHDPEVKIFF